MFLLVIVLNLDRIFEFNTNADLTARFCMKFDRLVFNFFSNVFNIETDEVK